MMQPYIYHMGRSPEHNSKLQKDLASIMLFISSLKTNKMILCAVCRYVPMLWKHKTRGNGKLQIQDWGNSGEERGMGSGEVQGYSTVSYVLFKDKNCSQFLQNVNIQQSWAWVSIHPGGRACLLHSSATHSPCDWACRTPLWVSVPSFVECEVWFSNLPFVAQRSSRKLGGNYAMRS